MTISLTRIILGFIFDFFLGGFWFSDAGFAQPWMKETGITKEKIEEGMKNGSINLGLSFGVQILLNIIGITGQIILLNSLNPQNLLQSVAYSFGIWIAFCAPGHLRCVLWEMKRFRYFLINSGYKLVSMLVLSVIFFI